MRFDGTIYLEVGEDDSHVGELQQAIYEQCQAASASPARVQIYYADFDDRFQVETATGPMPIVSS